VFHPRSRSGTPASYREIAATLARRLPGSESGRRVGPSTALAPAQQRPAPAPFDAVVQTPGRGNSSITRRDTSTSRPPPVHLAS
jgi:hypothetical protein